MPDYSPRPFIDCAYRKEYFHLLETTLEPFSHALFLQCYHIWLCSPFVLMPGIQIYAGCFQQRNCIIIIIIIIIDLITLCWETFTSLTLLVGLGTVSVWKFIISLKVKR